MKKNKSSLLVLLFCIVCYGQKINPAKLQNLLERAEETKSEAVIIYQGQDLIVEQYYGIGHRDTLIEAMSTTKSVVGLAVACLLDDGLLESLDVPVCKFYPEWNQGKKKDITIRHLVTMTSGLQNVPDTGIEIYPSNNFVQLALCAEF